MCEREDDDNGEWMQLLRPSELREVLEIDRARKEVERQIIHANQVFVFPGCSCLPKASFFGRASAPGLVLEEILSDERCKPPR